MVTTELKALLHQQIDRLDDPQDVRDLWLTVSEFVGRRTNDFVETPQFISELEQALTAAHSAQLTAHEAVIRESKQWITS